MLNHWQVFEELLRGTSYYTVKVDIDDYCNMFEQEVGLSIEYKKIAENTYKLNLKIIK